MYCTYPCMRRNNDYSPRKKLLKRGYFGGKTKMKKSLILSKMHQYGYSKRSVFDARSESAVKAEKFHQ